jgi:hypothetical protein
MFVYLLAFKMCVGIFCSIPMPVEPTVILDTKVACMALAEKMTVADENSETVYGCEMEIEL